jgi:hypothetical protein
MITMMLVTDSVVFRDMWGGQVVMMKEECGTCSNFLLRSSGKLRN